MPEPTLEKSGPSEAQLAERLLHLYNNVPKIENGRSACIDWLSAVIGFVQLAKAQRTQKWPPALEEICKNIFALQDTLVSREKFDQETKKFASPDVTHKKQERPISKENIENAMLLLAGVLGQLSFSDQSPRT